MSYRDKSADNKVISSSLINNFGVFDENSFQHNKIKRNDKGKNLVNILENLNLNTTVKFKDEGYQSFRKKIDKLNLKFFIETEKYVKNEVDSEKCNEYLFLNLFKQITLYSEEVDRLNFLILEITKGDDLTKSTIELNAEINRLKQEVENLKRNNRNAENNTAYLSFASVNSKKTISDDKLIHIKEVEKPKPNLSLSNFHPVKTNGTSVSISANSTNPTEVEVQEIKPKIISVKKRNLSENDPNLILKKNESKGKINPIEIKTNNYSSSKKQPAKIENKKVIRINNIQGKHLFNPENLNILSNFKSPTNKVSLNEFNSVSPQRHRIDEDLYVEINNFLDNEINEMTEMEMILKSLKNNEMLKLSLSNNDKDKPKSSLHNTVKKKYQLLNSVTIDLINSDKDKEKETSRPKKNK